MLHIVRSDGAELRITSLTDQVYSFEANDGWQFHWSISEAWQRALARGELYTVSLSEMGVTPERVRKHYDGLDEAYAMTTNLAEPLLFAAFQESDLLLDGHHRLFKAATLGVDELFAFFLTAEEADACLVCKLAPGQGLDWGQKASVSAKQRAETPRRKRKGTGGHQ